MAKNDKPMANRTKILKLLLKITVIFILLIAVLLVWFDQSRNFYCLSDNQCVTVWKRLGYKCYIVPGTYYGILKPSRSYIKTSNSQYLTLYFSDELFQKVIVRNQGSAEGQGRYEIKCSSQGDWEILEYSEIFESVLYKPGAKKFNEVESGTNYINLNIKENYGTDKRGQKISR